MRFQCNLKGPELFLEGGGGCRICARSGHHEHEARSPYIAAGVQGPLKGPGSSGVIDALWCNLSLFWTIYNLFETFFITQNVIKLRHVSYCHIQMIKKRNKQQSLAGRIDKLGGPEFENHCCKWWQLSRNGSFHMLILKSPNDSSFTAGWVKCCKLFKCSLNSWFGYAILHSCIFLCFYPFSII